MPKPSSSSGTRRKRASSPIKVEILSSDSEGDLVSIKRDKNPTNREGAGREIIQSLELTDTSDDSDGELTFSEQMKLKCKKNMESMQKRKEEILSQVNDECTVRDQKFFDDENVHVMAQYDQIQEDLARIKQLNKRFSEKEDLTKINDTLEFGEGTSHDINEAKCILRIIDINDVKYNDYGKNWEMDAPFRLLREVLSEKKHVAPECTTLTFNQQEIKDNQTPSTLDFLPDKVYTIEVVSVARAEKTVNKIDSTVSECSTAAPSAENQIILNFDHKKKKPISFATEMDAKFSHIAALLRAMGVSFKDFRFGGVKVEDEQTPADFDMKNGDTVDLI